MTPGPLRACAAGRGVQDAAMNDASHADRPSLLYTIAFDPPGVTSARLLARMLTGSAVRSYWPGEVVALVNAPLPLFMVPRAGLREELVETPDLDGPALQALAERWKAAAHPLLDGAAFEWVMFADADCVCLRGLEHLLREQQEADILYQTVPGRGVWEPEYGAFLTTEITGSPEREAKALPAARRGITSGVWAVRGEVYHAVMQEWLRLQTDELPLRDTARPAQAAWNRLVREAAQHGWRARPFESGEVAHPLMDDSGWRLYKDAALLHAAGGSDKEKREFLFGQYVQRYFYDPGLALLNIMDM
jgi:hypothetical protein